jgi:hypothetical protein
LIVAGVQRIWTPRRVGQAAFEKHIVVEANIFFENEENTKEYKKYLQACISRVHKMRTMTLIL